MKNSKILIIAFGLIVLVSIMTYKILTMTSKRNKINKEFPTLLTKDSVNHVVMKLFEFEGFAYTPTMVYVKMDDDRIFKIFANFNKQYSNKGIKQMLDIGDSIYKKPSSDSLWIKKRGRVMPVFFIINDKLPFEK